MIDSHDSEPERKGVRAEVCSDRLAMRLSAGKETWCTQVHEGDNTISMNTLDTNKNAKLSVSFQQSFRRPDL